MTDEEKAEAYAEVSVNDYKDGLVDMDVLKEAIADAFLAGLKAKWHDLREDQNDLPKGHQVVLNQVGEATTYDPDRGFLGFGGCGIIAWTEVPVFNKEDTDDYNKRG